MSKNILRDFLKNQIPIKRGSKSIWFLDESKLWYIDETQADKYLALYNSNIYKSGMHDTEFELLESNLNKICGFCKTNISLFDLGCGDAKKSLLIANKLIKRKSSLSFYPIDISPKILELAKENAKNLGIQNIFPSSIDFLDLEDFINKTNIKGQVFLYLGANFVNFESDHILGVLSKSCRSDDVVYFSAQCSDINIESIISTYNNSDISNFFFQSLKLIGFKQGDIEYKVKFDNNKSRIETYYQIKCVPKELQELSIKEGDEIVIGTSYKPKISDFITIAKKYFTGEIITNSDKSYVGFIGNKK